MIRDFDFSFESFAAADGLLEEARDFVVDENEIYNICTTFGCCVSETARRNYGGECYWLSNEQQPILVAGEPFGMILLKEKSVLERWPMWKKLNY